MAITKVELANMLLGVESTKKAAAKIKTSTIVGTAHNDSHDGYVLVDLGGDVISVDGKQYVSLATTSDVRAGDKVYVMLRGADGTAMGATVIGAAGGGDRTKGDIAAAAADAAAAQTDASSAISMVNAVKATADEHESQIDAIQKDIAAYKKSATATYATKTEVNEQTGAITKTIEADYTKTSDLSNTSAVKDAKAAGTAAQASIDGMRLGGRNLLKGTSMDPKAVTTPTTANTTWGSGFRLPADASRQAVIPYGAEYRCSVDVLLPVDGRIVVDMNTYAESGTGWTGNDNDNVSRRTQNAFNVKANVWTRLSWGSENTNAANTGKQAIYINDSVGLLPQSSAVTWHYRGLKVELGTKATDWTPAPEDVDSAVADAKKAGTDAQSTVDGMQIGGRNLALNSAKLDIAASNGNRYAASYPGGMQIAARADGLNEVRATSVFQGIGVFANALDLNAGDEVVFSAFAHALGADSELSFYAIIHDASNTRVYKKIYYIDNGSELADHKVLGTIEAGVTKKLAVKIKWTDEAKSIIDGGGQIRLTFQVRSQVASGNYVSFYAPKLERGTKATDWTPAPEDVDSAVADAKKAGTDAQSALDAYKTTVSETYAEKLELQQQVNLMKSTMTANYSSFTEYRTSNDTALSKAQTDATNAQSTIDSYKQSNDKAVADAKSAGTTAQNQLSSYKSSNDAAVKDAKKAGTDAQADLNSYKGTTDQRLDELKNIADNAIESFYLKGAPTASNPPASTWTTDALKKQHAGDLYMDTDTGYSYRWSGTEWVQVKDSDVTKALTEIANIKTDYATKTELEQTNTSLSAKVEDSLSTAKTYASGLVSTEVTQRNAAITARANEISQQVSKTYTKSETFSAYQSDADSRIATANSNASTAKSTAQTAATDAATAKTDASSAVSTANAAKSTAQTASANASNAVSTANSANSKSDSAVSTADAAKSAASAATSTANTAKSTADTAKSTADAAKTAAANAQASANSAQNAADKAQSSADDTAAALAKAAVRIRIDGTPMADGTSQLMAHVYVGNDEVSASAIAKLGTLVWKMDGVADRRGTTTYTAQTGKFVTCRLEA